MSDFSSPHAETHEAWEANAEVWDAKMGDEGNDFFRLLQWPVMTEFLEVESWPRLANPPRVLDVACGNGLTSRKLVELGAEVTAFDFSANLIELARTRPYASAITYRVVDATDEEALLRLGKGAFDSALCNMSLFDMAEIEPLFRALPQLLKPGGSFVFSITHPAFNKTTNLKVAEEVDYEGTIKTTYFVKISRYLSCYEARGIALRGQPKPQVYFERPLQYYLNLGFTNGFVLDGFAERAFPPEVQTSHPLSWGGQFSEIPPVLVARMRLL
jgi:2-polyprenyl-3-methyl-5-hydroxy-6-metoxy-1,4-benzoquinol methylase